MSFLVGGILDPHMSSSNPDGRVDDYAFACLDKLRQVSMLADARGWNAILVAGDLWNTATVARWFETGFNRLVRDSVCPWYSILGNHDLKYRRVEGADETIMGSMFASGVLRDLTKEPFSTSAGSMFGMHFFTYPNGEIPKAEGDRDWLICHQFVSTGEAEEEETINISAIKEAGYRNVLAGHEHSDVGVQVLNGVQVVRCGSMLRHENTASNRRQPRVVEIDIVTGKVQLIELDAKPPEDVFRTKREEISDGEVFDMDRLREFALSMESREFQSGHEAVGLLKKLEDERGLIIGSDVHSCIAQYFDQFGLR